MRFAAYAGTSMILATGVVIRALHERANFYSACVYLAQSNACLMVLTNIALLGVCTAMLGLQRLFYGPLRPIEVEQLYEKAWFAITETCLAMTIFREEVGGWFLVMFVCLLVGKVWGWIGEGRVEILEQQPPSNPRLFHARLSVSLIISTLFDIYMLRYSISTVLRHARPNMMVMFAFEFAVLTVTSMSTAARYTISLHEAHLIKSQIKTRREQIRREREVAQSSQAVATDSSTTPDAPANNVTAEEDIDSLDIDVPGWEEKGRWVFYLDLTTDFFKLVLYLTFFCVLCMFYGMPIHIIRDVALTIRSFYKRITDFVRYRQATRDMNARYPDATAEEVAREDVCIICREDMRPWRQQTGPDPQQADNARVDGTAPTGVDERLRPKKLPCGHILHFACLRSWLERQQNCPTCRGPVLVTGTVSRTQEHNLANQHGRDQGHPNHARAHVPAHGNVQQPVAAQNVFNLGPLRIAFGARQVAQGPPQQMNNNPHPPAQQGPVLTPGQIPRVANTFGFQRQPPGLQSRAMASFSPSNLQLQLYQIEQQLVREINGLRIQQNQLHLVRALLSELARLRVVQTNPESFLGGAPAPASQSRPPEAISQTAQLGQNFVSGPQPQSMGHSHPDLPAGITIPPGWNVLPLQRLPDRTSTHPHETSVTGASGTSLPSQSDSSPTSLVPTDAAVTTNPITSQTIVTPNHESSPTLLVSGATIRNDPASLQATNETFSSSSGTGDRSMARTAISSSSRDEHPEAVSHAQQANGDGAGSGAYPQPKVPDWGSGVQSPAPSQKNSKLGGFNGDEIIAGDEGALSQPLAGNRLAKGKGKASTVEDATEDAN